MHRIERLKLHNVKIIEIIIFKIENKSHNFEYDLEEAFYNSNCDLFKDFIFDIYHSCRAPCEYKVFKA